MTFWLDAQLAPQLAPQLAAWISTKFGVECKAVRDLGLRDAMDPAIFAAARAANAVVITKDKEFVSMVMKNGAPPQVLWITCGNTSNARMQEILEKSFATAQELLSKSEPLVEISDQ